MHKLGPAAQGNLACRNHFSLHFFVQAQKSREKVSPQIFPFGKSSRRGVSCRDFKELFLPASLSLILKTLSPWYEANWVPQRKSVVLLAEVFWEAKERQASSAPSLRELAHHSANADDETEGVALFSQVRFR